MANTGSGSSTDENVCKELARVNGLFNRMNKGELVDLLTKLHLDKRGSLEVLRKRLKSYYKQQKLQTPTRHCHFDYLCIVDFEATCDAGKPSDYVHEIIEFPAVLLCVHTLQTVHEFRRYCRPIVNSKLTNFCTTLTGITQEQVDSSDTFPVVLSEFESWLKHHQLGTKYKFAVVTDCFADLGLFFPKQCLLSGVPVPKFAKHWINIRKIFSNFYDCKRLCLNDMLERLGLVFEGQQHCGLDDASNIARIVIKLLSDGAIIDINETVDRNRFHDVKPVNEPTQDHKQHDENHTTDSDFAK